MDGLDTRKMKSIELEMLKEFIQICEKLGLMYYLVGGTLLGAVRHKGFIPWDDDIDVAMPREDYARFEKEAQQYMPEYYFIQTRNTDPELLNGFMKIRDSRTTFIETSMKNCRINHGVYIDVFPLDYYPEERWTQRLFDMRHKILKYRIRGAFTLSEKAKHAPHIELGLRIVSEVLSVLYPTASVALDKKDKLYLSVKRSRFLANYCGAWGKKEIVPAEWFGDGVTVDFEGINVNAPTEYKKWLTQIYGDYMQLPPVEKRVTHHYTEVIDLNKPYTEYINYSR